MHDFDYGAGRIPDHPLEGAEILTSLGYPEHVIYAIKSHADYLTDCPRRSRLDKTLYACDELAGFVVAVAILRPERAGGMQGIERAQEVEAKGFAAAVNRDDIAAAPRTWG